MIRKSGHRFSEKIMLHQNARAKSLQSEAISLVADLHGFVRSVKKAA
jgi:hypothetical protein